MLTADLPDARLTTDTPSVDAMTLKAGDFTFRTLPAEIGELSETMALASKRRLHESADGAELMFETVNTIPFGAEPEVHRKVKISEGLVAVTQDLVMRASCQLTSVSAGGFVVSGPILKFALVLPPAKGCSPDFPEKKDFAPLAENSIVYDAPYPPLALMLESEKQRFDWMIGDDLWRWTNAERIGGGNARFTIKREKNALRMEWKLFEKLPVRNGEEELPIPGRNWRLTWAAAWKGLALPRRKKAVRTFDLTAFAWEDNARAVAGRKKNAPSGRGCFCASATQSVLKKWLRSDPESLTEGNILEIANVTPAYCVNAGHADRSKYQSLPHWDMMSVIEFRRWANRTLGAKGASLRICAPTKSPWRGFMVLD
ncbi:MAG: hypothetical protein IJS14_12175 [Lentisphaeria bacterium]|nr:hypothetical protein [Lentisphaeria bacterium]